jgi:general stress protein YciG
MTYQSPRIYLYKITFEEVPYYYYGVHKEKVFEEYYMGSPHTHKWCWELYTPKKQILEIFEFTDDGWLEALGVEKRIIKPFYNIDKWCLNESCGGVVALEINRKTGKLSSQKCKELNIGIFSLSKQQLSENGKKGGNKVKELSLGICGLSVEERIKNGVKNYELGIGIHALSSNQKSEFGKIGGEKMYQMKKGIFSLSPEERSKHSKKGGNKSKELGVGIHGLSKEQLSENNRKNGYKHKKNKTGIFSLTEEERSKNGKKSGKRAHELGVGIHALTPEQRSENGRLGGTAACKIINAQRWECCETGYVSTAAGIISYQKARGIDTSKSNRRRIS